MNKDKKECKNCGTLNPVEAVNCKNCGNNFREFKEEDRSILNALKQISGVGSNRAKNIVNAGYSDIEDLDDIKIDSFTSIEGIGESIAKEIVHTIEEKKKEGDIFLCGDCGAFVGENTEKCPNCGAKMVEDTSDEMVDEPEKSIKDEGEEDGSLFLCSNCGSFVGAETNVCPHCGYEMIIEEDDIEEGDKKVEEEIENEGEEDIKEESEEGGLFLCSNCGSFVGADSELCPHCGHSFSEGDEIEEKEFEKAPSKDIKEVEHKDEKIGYEETIEKDLTPETYDMDFDLKEDRDSSFIDGSKEDSILKKNETGLETEKSEIDESIIGSLPIGDDVKICGNCGWISKTDVNECPVCGDILKEKEIIDDSSLEKSDDLYKQEIENNETILRKALGVSEIPEEIEEKDLETKFREEGEVEICTVCGAFLNEGQERCSVCGSLISETPDIQVEEETGLDYTDQSISICDACGAFVRENQDQCPICGSDMEYARREVENEEISKSSDSGSESFENFFGSTEIESMEETKEDVQIYLCNICGAFVNAEAETCPICNSDISDEIAEPSDNDKIRKEDNEYIDTSDEIYDELDHDQSRYEDEIILEDKLDESYEGRDYNDSFDEDISEKVSEISEEELDRELGLEDDIEFELNEEIESILKNIDQENVNKKQVKGKVKKELNSETGEDRSVEEILDEISNDIINDEEPKELFKESGPEEKEEITGSESWEKCPVCGSHVSSDSDFCSVCENSLTKIDKKAGEKPRIKTFTEEEAAEELKVTKEALKGRDEKQRIGSLFEGISKGSENNNQKIDFVESHISSNIKEVLYKAKDYEVPISSLSLLAFGGVYISTYNSSSFSYFAELAMILLGVFFSLGICTLLLFKEELLSNSMIGVIGYIIAISLSSFVLIQKYIIGLEMPLLAIAGIITLALGMFWMLDHKLPRKFQYYMLWFSGISILFIGSLTILFFTTSISLSNFEYPLLLPLGLGSILVIGGTANWYQESYEYNVLPSETTSEKSSIITNYHNTNRYFEDLRKNCPVNNEETLPYYSKGIAYCSMGRYNDAVDKFEEAIDIEGDNEAIWNNLGTAYSRMGDQEKAKKCLKNAINLNNEYAIAWNNLGNANFRCGNYSRSLDCYNKALEIEKSYRDAQLNKSQVLIKLSKMDD